MLWRAVIDSLTARNNSNWRNFLIWPTIEGKLPAETETAVSHIPPPEDESPYQSALLHHALIQTVEAERQRLATRLHTSLYEQIRLILSQINAYEQAATGQSRMAFSVVTMLVQQLLQQVVDLETQLHPAILESAGLRPALEALITQQRRATGLNITLEAAPLRERLPAHLELALFRTTQDVIERILEQGTASTLSLKLQRQDNRLTYRLGMDAPLLDAAWQQATARYMMALGGEFDMVADSDRSTLTITFALLPPIELTPREEEVLRLLVEGLSNKEIAAALDVRPRTVKFHLDNLYSKLGVNTRTEAAVMALRQGWLRR